jgi:hypothetical protein
MVDGNYVVVSGRSHVIKNKSPHVTKLNNQNYELVVIAIGNEMELLDVRTDP